MTALGMAETAKLEGHRAILHTAAASNLGQMMQKICSADGIPLINIVRSKEQVDLLRGIGAVHVLNSVDGDFRDRLIDAIAETDATIAFRSEEHTSELQSLMRISYAVFCLKKKT